MKMTLYEMTKKYGEGKGEAMMWTAVETISEAIEKSMDEKDKEELMKHLYGKMSGGHFDEPFAMEAVSKMYYVDKNGAKHTAPYWTTQVVKPIYDSIKSQIPSYTFWDFYVTLNMMAADNWNLIETWFPGLNTSERDQKMVELAVNWLKDPDATFDHKIWKYLNGDA